MIYRIDNGDSIVKIGLERSVSSRDILSLKELRFEFLRNLIVINLFEEILRDEGSR